MYGANAFLGIVNIITKDGNSLENDGQKVFFSSQYGSYNTKSIEFASIGKKSDLSYSFSSKLYQSDGPDLSKKWGFSSNNLYNDSNVWGPVLQHQNYNVKYGKYYSPADNFGIIGNLAFKGTKLGIINSAIKEGYGAYYAADRAQNNSFWNKSSIQFYIENKTEIDKFKLSSILLHRKDRISGTWAEATPDWNPGMERYSYISITEWNSVSNSTLFKEDVTYEINEKIIIQTGIKYERKKLTKSYDIPGYWGAYSSSIPSNTPGPYGFGAAIGHSSDSIYNRVTPPNSEMPADNLLLRDDLGGYVQLMCVLKQLRFNGGLRYDNNSFYGSNTNWRASLIYQFQKKGALKLIYGEAFQEPSQVLLYGGWNGRAANLNLKPEQAKNFELVGMYTYGPLTVDASLFYALYKNVIKEDAENAGERTIYGAECRTYLNFKNVIPKSSSITGYLFYTYTQSISSTHYNHTLRQWEEGETILGDIAPHKINLGLNLPLLKAFNVNLRGNYVSERLVYSGNALRAKDYKIESYFSMDGTISYKFKIATFSLKVKNITNANYFHPGGEQADSGDDFSKRSLGFRNSLIPQAGRSYMVSLNIEL